MFLRDLFQRLADADVAYCLVGGVAVNLHGVPRMTYDVDLVAELSHENLSSLEQVLRDLGLRCQLPVQLSSLSDPERRAELVSMRNLIAVTFTDPDNLLREVDVLISTEEPAEKIVGRAANLDLEGTTVKLANVDDLIRMKESSGRDQDLDDIDHLQRIRDQRGRGNS